MSQTPSDLCSQIADAFRDQEPSIGTPPHRLNSNAVLAAVAPGLERIGFVVETSKTRKVKVPVLFGLNGRVRKAFEVDGWNASRRAVIEIEAGIAIDARKIYQDLFEAFAMADVDFVCIAVQNAYHPGRRSTPLNDFERASAILDTLFASSRFRPPMSSVMLLGY